MTPDSTVPSDTGRPRNQHCMNCGDTRGGPVGHETSECTYDSAAGAVRDALKPGFKLTLSRLILAAQQDTYPLADADDTGGPYIVDGCVVYGAQQLTDALRTVWKYTPPLLRELEDKRAEAEKFRKGMNRNAFLWGETYNKLKAAREENASLQGRLDTAEAALREVDKLHQRKTLYSEPDADWSYESAGDAADGFGIELSAVISFDICEHCGDIESDGSVPYLEALWPCKTTLAYDLGEGDGQ